MASSLAGKAALVTGAASGIGRAIVTTLLKQGLSVSACDVNTKVREEMIEKFALEHHDRRFMFLECDVTDDKQLEDCFRSTKSQFARLDLVINSAAVADERYPAWKNMIDVNLKGAILITRLGLQYMGLDHGGSGGTVVNIGSTTCFQPFPSAPVYSSIKKALNWFTAQIGDELYLKPSGVRVICLNPGYTETPLSQRSFASLTTPELQESAARSMASYTLQSADHVASALLEVLDKAESGSSWSVYNGLPPVPSRDL